MANPNGDDVERRNYRKVFKRLWSNRQFLSLTDTERLIALYVLAGPQTSRIGLFRFSIPMAAEDLQRPENTIRPAFIRVVTAFKWEWDSSARVLWIPSWWKFNAPRQANNLKGALTDLNDVPSTPLLTRFCHHLADVPIAQHALMLAWDAQSPDATESGQCPDTVSTETELPDVTKTRRNEDQTEGCTEPLRDSPPPLLVFPTTGPVKEWPLYHTQVTGWQASFDTVNVAAECRKAYEWIKANPGRKKTANGMAAFLVRWFNKAANTSRGPVLVATGTDGRGRTGAPPAGKYDGIEEQG